MPEIQVFETLHKIKKDDWNKCFVNNIEDYDYLISVEEAGIKDFEWRYITAWDNDVMLAAMPAFLNDYNIDTTLQGIGKRITGAIKNMFPNLLKLKLACLGSPCTESGIVGFHHNVDETAKPNLLQQILREFETYALSQKCQLIAIKDLPETQKQIWNEPVTRMKYSNIPGMPTAYIDIDFKSIDEYMGRLSAATRKDMRRKIKTKEQIRIEHRKNIDDVLPQILELYKSTRSRSDWQFEELTEKYFKNILNNMEGAFCILYWVDEKLLAANLLIQNEKTLIDKFFCMGIDGRQYNLYFLSWFTNLEYCLSKNIYCYQSGQAYYKDKIRLGSHLIRNHMYFKHRNSIAQGLLRLVSPFLAADETAELIKEAA